MACYSDGQGHGVGLPLCFQVRVFVTGTQSVNPPSSDGIGGRSRPASVIKFIRRQGTTASPAVVCRVSLRVSAQAWSDWYSLKVPALAGYYRTHIRVYVCGVFLCAFLHFAQKIFLSLLTQTTVFCVIILIDFKGGFFMARAPPLFHMKHI